CMYFTEPCPCGRKSLRLSPVIGRKQQMLKYKGTTFYPPALFDLLNEMEEVLDFVVEVYSDELGLDEVLINLHTTCQNDSFDQKIKTILHSRLRVCPLIKYKSESEIQGIQYSERGGKPRKFVDHRK
ncbi:MAG: phenylacetate--CoA ligase family protein, partial [Chitinophagaceae bacterium]